MTPLVVPEELPPEARKLMQGVLDVFVGQSFEMAMNVLINLLLFLVKKYGQSNYAFLREYIENHIQAHEAVERREQGGAAG